jgi:hypothetical protein
LVYDRTHRDKESIQGHPLDPKQAMSMFSVKAVGNFKYLAAITPWKQRELDSLDRYWRQGFKTAWRLNEGTTDHPWTTPKNMAGMGYATTLVVLSHTLHTHIERCMKTEDVVRQMMKNDLDRSMKDWLCTSKEELTGEAEARSWDETIDNVWFRMTMCDHLLEFKTWRQVMDSLGGTASCVMVACCSPSARSPPLARSTETTMGTTMAGRNSVEEIWGTYMGRGP